MMVRDLRNSTDQQYSARKRPGNGGFIQMVRNFPPFHSDGKRGVLLKVLYNFRTDFPENYLTISLQSEISGFFGQMVSTPSFPTFSFTYYIVLHVDKALKDKLLETVFGSSWKPRNTEKHTR